MFSYFLVRVEYGINRDSLQIPDNSINPQDALSTTIEHADPEYQSTEYQNTAWGDPSWDHPWPDITMGNTDLDLPDEWFKLSDDGHTPDVENQNRDASLRLAARRKERSPLWTRYARVHHGGRRGCIKSRILSSVFYTCTVTATF